MEPGGFFSKLGRTDLNFEILYFLDFFGSQISRFPGPQISKFPEIWPGPGWAGLGLGCGPLGWSGSPRVGQGILGWAVWVPRVGPRVG